MAEPWQMPKEDFVKVYLERFKRMLSKAALAEVTQEEFQKEREEAIDYQKHTIKQALKAGRPVPPEVLRDYPELKEINPSGDVPEVETQPYLEKYRKLVEKYPDRIDKHLERAKDEKASLVLGREFSESFDDYLEHRPDVKRRWDELTIAIEEMEQREIKGSNPARVRFDRADIDSAIAAAKRLQSEKDLYIFATHLGYTIDHRPPPGMQSYVIVHPDGSTETVRPMADEDNPGLSDNLLPMSPEEGPPLPRGLNIKWPWKK